MTRTITRVVLPEAAGGIGVVPCDHNGEQPTSADAPRDHLLVAASHDDQEVELVVDPKRALWLALALLDKVREMGFRVVLDD